GVFAATAATSNIVSPYRITTEPSACFATFPVSTVNSRSPSLIDSLRYFFTAILVLSPSDNCRCFQKKQFAHASRAPRVRHLKVTNLQTIAIERLRGREWLYRPKPFHPNTIQ